MVKRGSNTISALVYALLAGLIALTLSIWSARAETAKQSAACTNSFAGAVYFDQNLDGSRNSNEGYLPGQIAIVDEQGTTQQIIQSGDGVFSASQLSCNTYTIHHNQLPVGTVVIGEVMSQEVKMFPKVQTCFFPIVAREAKGG